MSGTDLNEVEFNTVFSVENGRPVAHHEHMAPEVTHDPDGDVQVWAEGWRCMTGYTGQYGYHGAVMHPSEYLGGQMEADMKDPEQYEPGTLFAVVEVIDLDAEDSDDPVGWVVAYREPTASTTARAA